MGAAERFIERCNLSELDAAVERGVLTVSCWSDEPPWFGEDEQDYINRAGWALQDELDVQNEHFFSMLVRPYR
jgi:hypothetical protein